MDIQKTIKDLIGTVVGREVAITLEHPASLEHGDFSTNIAMQQAKNTDKSPRELAVEIASAIPTHPHIAKVDVAGPGFINFYLSDVFFIDSIHHILAEDAKWGNTTSLAGKRVMVEYTDPNPFKELHIGHLVPNSLGVAIARLVGRSGAEVREVTFQGDVGMHVAKAVYGMQHMGLTAEQSFSAQDLGKAYALGARAFEESDITKQEITALNKRIYAIYTGEETELKPLYERGKEVSLAYFDAVYALLNSNFSHFFFESATGPIGERMVRANIGTVFTDSDGAVIFQGEEHGLHTRVFINAQGIPTYEAKDLGLVEAKHAWWPHDISITITGGEQEPYFKVMRKAMSLIQSELGSKMCLVANGMLELKEGKMSSRTGNVIRAVDLIDDVKAVIRERMPNADDTAVTQVAVGAIKYSILKSSTNKNIKFDFDTSLSFDGDSGPYLQYTYARCHSLLEKGGYTGSVASYQYLNTTIERLLYRFTTVMERAAREYEPHYVVEYLNELASAYNSWYAGEKIVDGTALQESKLALTHAVAITIKNGLNALGIDAPERM